MKKIFFLLFSIILINVACKKEPDCRTCTGEVTNTGEMGNFTVCYEDDVLTQTNNITSETITSSNTLPESVAFLESIGLECSE